MLSKTLRLETQEAPTVPFLSTKTIHNPMVINMTNKPIGAEGRDQHGRNVTNFVRKCTMFASLLICEVRGTLVSLCIP